jgi:hypothetical protein
MIIVVPWLTLVLADIQLRITIVVVMRRCSCIVVVLATRAGVHEAANLRALVSWPIGGRRVCLALASMGTVLDKLFRAGALPAGTSTFCSLNSSSPP